MNANTWRRLSCSIAWVSAVAIGIASAVLAVGDLRQFSGNWEGDFLVTQLGDCTADGGVRSKHAARLVVTVESDGAVTAREHFEGATVPVKDDWKGHLSPDLTIKLETTTMAMCRGGRNDYRLEYTGKIKQRKGKSELELKALDAACPDAGCTFQRMYKLTQR